MTLTVLGLSLRDETLVKSLLNVVGGNTSAEWRFVDELDADLALCDPQSSFARIALEKSALSGRPYCVALLYGQDTASPLTRSIRAPLRVSEFVEMLDALSDFGGMQGDVRTPSIQNSSSNNSHASNLHTSNLHTSNLHANNTRIEQRPPLIDTLRELVAAHDASQPPAVWRIETCGLSLNLMLPERKYVLSDHQITVDALVTLALSARVDNVMRLDPTDADAARAATTVQAWDLLLWRFGLRVPPDADMPWFKDDVALRLKRWPDLGRLGAQKSHLVLAALMTKASWRSDTLLEASGQTLAEMQAFVSACGFCGLLDIQNVPSLKTVPPVASRRLGVSGLFRSLRSALRMGG